jgi:magnesium-protoporphyrin O-methyltransferase
MACGQCTVARPSIACSTRAATPRRGPAIDASAARRHQAGLDPDHLLDIGGGVGRSIELDAGAEAVHDASPPIDAASEEATRRRHLEAVEFVQGDFVTVAPDLAAADVVTLDRVICCYPDMPALVGAAADKAQRILGAVYPPNTWWMRIGARCVNYIMRLRESEFRVFVHPTDAIEAVLREHGLERATRRRMLLWEISTFTRFRSA